MSVKTDRVAPTRQEYIASTQRAFEKGGEVFKQNPSAFTMGAPVEGKSSSVDSTPYVQLIACTIRGSDADEQRQEGIQEGKEIGLDVNRVWSLCIHAITIQPYTLSTVCTTSSRAKIWPRKRKTIWSAYLGLALLRPYSSLSSQVYRSFYLSPR